MRRLAALALFGAALAGCDYFASPIPGFLDRVVQIERVNVSDILGDLAGDPGVRFDLVMIGSGADRRLLLKVEPPNNDPDTFEYRGRVLVFNPDLEELGRIVPETTLDYLSSPYGYGHDGDLLVGYSIYDPVTFAFVSKLPRSGLEGFIVVDDATVKTHQFALPSGAFSAFHLEVRTFYLDPWSFDNAPVTSVEIIAGGSALSGDPAQAQLGYQLLGVARDATDLLFLLSRPSQQIILGARAPLAGVVDGSVPVLLTEGSDLGFALNADRPQARVDASGFFLLKRDGWLERYDWEGTLIERVVGDTSFSRRYAFDVEGGHFYRFDADSLTLTRIAAWW